MPTTWTDDFSHDYFGDSTYALSAAVPAPVEGTTFTVGASSYGVNALEVFYNSVVPWQDTRSPALTPNCTMTMNFPALHMDESFAIAPYDRGGVFFGFAELGWLLSGGINLMAGVAQNPFYVGPSAWTMNIQMQTGPGGSNFAVNTPWTPTVGPFTLTVTLNNCGIVRIDSGDGQFFTAATNYTGMTNVMATNIYPTAIIDPFAAYDPLPGEF